MSKTCDACGQKLPRTASQIGKSNVATSKVHERRIAKLFSIWSGAEFRRRRVEGREPDTIIRDATGDVIPVSRRCWFNIEAKKGEGFSLDAIINIDTIGTTKFTEWWHQSFYDAKIYSDTIGYKILPIVMFKPHPNWDWIAFSQHALEHLRPSDAYWEDDRKHVVHPASTRVGVQPVMSHLWFPAFKIDAYADCGPISCNVKYTAKKENKEFVPLELDPCYIARWKTFAENVKPESFFIPET